MNTFQYLLLALFVLLGSATARAGLRGGIRKRMAVFWLMIWIAGAVTAIWPSTTVHVARALGIGRGTDLVLYCSVLMMLVGFFYSYTRFRRLDRSLTLLVRKLAVENPVLPAATPRAPAAERE